MQLISQHQLVACEWHENDLYLLQGIVVESSRNDQKLVFSIKPNMTPRELFKRNFGIDFPISGGFGNSREAPIIIHRQVPNDYTSVEYGILRCLGIGRRVKWRVLQQALLEHEGRMLDQMKIETIELTPTEQITQVENYYFDITECFDSDS